MNSSFQVGGLSPQMEQLVAKQLLLQQAQSVSSFSVGVKTHQPLVGPYHLPRQKVFYQLPEHHGLKKWLFFTWRDKDVLQKKYEQQGFYDARLTDPLQ